jgi:uncharacterized protein (TIGR03083 family)
LDTDDFARLICLWKVPCSTIESENARGTQHSPMKRPNKIIIVDRFAPLRTHLLTLLAELGEDDWTRPTAAPRWSVKDVAAHLLGGDIAILSGKRDGFRLPQKIQGYDQLIELVDRLNAEWLLAARRMSPRLVRELLAFTGPEVEACFASLDPMGMGGAVSWAGPDPAPIWFDLAREFTERWRITSNRFGTPRATRHSTPLIFCRQCWIHLCERSRTLFAIAWRPQEHL